MVRRDVTKKSAENINSSNDNEKPHVRPALKKKIAKLQELIELSKKYKSISIVSAVKTPNKIIQKLKKQLKGKAVFAMANLVVLRKCLEAVAPALVSSLKEPSYLVFSNYSPYEMYSIVNECRERVYASAGAISTSDILIEKTTTELQPGPVLTELKTAGLDVFIDKGKIAIRSDKVIVKKGEKITKHVANALRLLNIKPLEIFVRYTAGFAGNIVYDSSLLSEYHGSSVFSMVSDGLKAALNLSLNANFYTPENASILIKNAYVQANSIAFTNDLITDNNLPALLSKGVGQANAIGSYVKFEEGEKK